MLVVAQVYLIVHLCRRLGCRNSKVLAQGAASFEDLLQADTTLVTICCDLVSRLWDVML